MQVDAHSEALVALAAAGENPLVRSFPQGAVFAWDPELRYLSAGGRGLGDVGLSRTMLEGRTIFEVFPPETAAAIEPLYRAALLGQSTTVDVPYEGRIYSQHLAPVLDRGGDIVAGMGFTRDVTEVRDAERALRESEERSRLSFEHAPIGQALVELDGRWRQVNAAVVRLLGYTEEQLLGMTFQDITHPDDLDADLALVQQLLDGQMGSYQLEKRYVTATGAVVSVLLAVSLVRDSHDDPLYFIAQIQDVTALRRQQPSPLRSCRRSCGCTSATTAGACRPSSCRGSSTGSAGPTLLERVTSRVLVSASTSSRACSTPTTPPSPTPTLPAVGPPSASACPEGRARWGRARRGLGRRRASLLVVVLPVLSSADHAWSTTPAHDVHKAVGPLTRAAEVT